MMGDLVKLPVTFAVRNGAREVIQRYFDEDTFQRYVSEACAPTGNGEGLCAGDHLLAWLWVEGFKVVPLAPKDEPK